MTKATPFLMFQHGKAEAALDFYVATVPGSRIVSIERFGPDGPGPEGTVLRAHVEIAGQEVMAHDSFITHGFDFTPSFSFFVDCADMDEVERLFAALSEGGAVLMPLDNYGWSERFGWVSDRFGVSWQLSLG
ncbi:VOC family protein [Sphingomonas gilva]|uniref:VOC family protein n=1 Tax=Sphingomonas gilva TaxID=2305907 RepID=A0A396RN95_9SPHN|nr:VOC family protein [Sphingomonas gilva]RHW17934.1 VOC family protein [Sphingomonas gilva]